MDSFFSKNFKYLRKQRNMSQAELANRLSISRSKIASYEVRGVEPRLSLLVEIARFFNVSLTSLIGTDIEESIREKGISSVRKFGIPDQSKNNRDQKESLYLNINQNQSLENFLKQSATIVKMLEGFQAFYKIKSENIDLSDASEEVKQVHQDINNVLFLIDYLVQHNQSLITVLKNAEAA